MVGHPILDTRHPVLQLDISSVASLVQHGLFLKVAIRERSFS